MKKRVNLYDAYAIKSKRRAAETIRNLATLVLIGVAFFLLAFAATLFLD